MHTMWKGSISFGLVNIPVKLHSATESKDIKLRQLHKECQNPIKYEKVCPVCDREVEKEEIVSAFEYTKNKFVMLEKEEMESIKEEKTDKSVEIIDFVKLEEIDPIYFDRSYYLSPNEGGSKAYSLLREALNESGKIGLAKIMIRSKEQLAVVRIYKNTLVMETIHYPDEVRDVEEVPSVPEADQVAKKELDTAKLLIDQLTTEFKPEKYTDDYRTALLELIEKKKAGEDIATAKETPTKPDNVTDLMSALEASLEKTSKEKSTKTKTTKKKTTKKKPAKAN